MFDLLTQPGKNQYERVHDAISIWLILFVVEAKGNIVFLVLLFIFFKIGARMPQHCLDLGVHCTEAQVKD